MAKALVIAAPASGSGKTVVTLGLIRALRHRGLRVASAKIGPDYIDPAFHAAASGRPCFNLDPWAMGKSQITALLGTLAADADIIVVEGVMGLFDGPEGARGSTADLAEDLGLPAVLVVDASRQSQSVAALVHGFATYRPGLNLAGVILNRLASDRHEVALRGALGTQVLGTLRRNDSLSLQSRQLGLVQAEEHQELEQFIETAASAVARETNLDSLLTIASQVVGESVIRAGLPPLGQRLAVTRDEAFSFAYPHLLHGWRKAGAEILPFSPLADEAPATGADAIFLPGGYPELHAGRIASNSRFLGSLRSAKGPIYGECGGFMVLGERIIDKNGTGHPMAGLLPLATSFAAGRLSLGYRQLRPLAGLPWRQALRGHEFHCSTVVTEGTADRLFAASDAAGNDLGAIGLRLGNVMGSFAHAICEAP